MRDQCHVDQDRAEPWAKRVWGQECKVAPGSVEGCSEGWAECWARRKQAPKASVRRLVPGPVGEVGSNPSRVTPVDPARARGEVRRDGMHRIALGERAVVYGSWQGRPGYGWVTRASGPARKAVRNLSNPGARLRVRE